MGCAGEVDALPSGVAALRFELDTTHGGGEIIIPVPGGRNAASTQFKAI